MGNNKKVAKLKEDRIREYRRSIQILGTLIQDIEKKFISDQELFDTSFFYDAFASTAMLDLLYICGIEYDFQAPYARKLFESITFLLFSCMKSFNQDNYKTFKLQAMKYRAGRKEVTQLAKKLKLSYKVLMKLINTYSPIYLMGVIEDYSRIRNLILEFTSLTECSKAINVYDQLSLVSHQSGFSPLKVEQFHVSYAIEIARKICSEVLSSPLKEIKKIEIGKINEKEIDSLLIDNLGQKAEIFLDKIKDAKELCETKSPYKSILVAAINGFATYLKILLYCYAKNLIMETFPLIKALMEKGSIYLKVCKLNLGEGKKRLQCFLIASDDLQNKNSRALFPDFEFDLLSTDKDFEKHKAYTWKEIGKSYNLTKVEFFNKIDANPSYIIYKKDLTLSEAVKYGINIVDQKNLQKYINAYIHGVEFSHANGFAIFQDKEKYKADVLYAVNYCFLTLEELIKLTKNEVKENKCLDEKKNKKPDFVGDDILLDLRRRNCSILSKEEDKLDLSEENNFKKYSDLVEEIDSCNRILKKTFLKKYQSDIDKYIKVSEIVTEDEVECFEQANNEN